MRDLSLCFGKPVVELVRKSDQVICEWGDVAVEGFGPSSGAVSVTVCVGPGGLDREVSLII